MRRFAPILILITMLAIAAATVAAEGDAKGPRAVPLEPVKDFDIVAKGEVIVHSFEISNRGTEPLELTDVRPACGCTIVSYDRTIAPGESGQVRTRVKTDNFSGPISKSIAVFTNDPDNPKLQLVVKANVTPYLAVLPGFARYNTVQGEPIQPIYQTLWAEDEADYKILSVKPPYDNLKVTHYEATADDHHPKGKGKQWRFEFALDPNSPVGALRDYVEIYLDHPKQKVVKIPISGFVRPRQHITPDRLNFGQLEGSSLPHRRTLQLTNFITDAIQLTDVETGYRALTAEIRESETDIGYRFQLLLTVGPDMPRGRFESVITIHTTDEQSPILELPIKGSIL